MKDDYEELSLYRKMQANVALSYLKKALELEVQSK